MLAVRALGPLEAERDGATLALGGTLARTLLAALVLEAGAPVSADRLCDALWEDVQPTTAKERLRVTMTRLRTALGEPIPHEPAGYRLDLGALDVWEFERELSDGSAARDPRTALEHFDRALALWRGDPYADVTHAAFAHREIARLAELRLTALELRIDALLALGRERDALTQLEALVAEHPLRERLRGQLMLALYRLGRQADALEVFRSTQAFFLDELGLRVSPDLRELEAAILRQDPSLTPARHGSRTALPGRLETVRRAPLVGRAAERARLDEAVAHTLAGKPVVTLLAGEPGIGKTSLAAYAAERARDRGGQVLYGWCTEELGVPYQPFRIALDDLIEHAPQALLDRHIATHGTRLARLAPALAGRADAPAEPPAGEPESERWLLFGAVAALLAQAAEERPLTLVLDDLHWADRLTVALLRHVLDLPAPGLHVLATYRSTEVDGEHPLQALIADASRQPQTRHVALDGLAEGDVASLIEQHGITGDTARLARDMRRESRGNPFFIGELLRDRDALPGTAPPQGVRSVILRRVARLGERARDVLAAAAVIGAEFESELLERLTGTPEDELAALLDAAAAAALIDPAPRALGHFAFTHDLIARSLYEELGPATRRVTHGKVLAELERTGAPISSLAHHALAAVRTSSAPAAIDYAQRAGDEALEALSPDAALRWYRRALTVNDELCDPENERHGELLIRIGRAEYAAGDGGFRETLLAAGRFAAARGDSDRVAEAALANNRGLVSSALVVDADRIALLQQALDGSEDHLRRAELLALLAAEETFAGDWPRRRELAAEALRLARATGDERVLCRVLQLRYATLWVPETLSDRLDEAEEAVRLAEVIGDDSARMWSLHWHCGACIETGDMAGAVAGNRQAAALAARLGDPTGRWLTSLVSGVLAVIAGRLDEAEEIVAVTGQLAYETGQPDAVAFQGSLLANIRWEQGRAGELLPLADLLSDEARESLLREAARFDTLPYDVTWLTALVLYGDVAVGLGELDVIRDVYARVLPWADQVVYNGLSAWLSASHHLGRLAAALGDTDAALHHFEAAERRHAAMNAPLWLARTRREREQVLLTL